jgi:hypothetical protein
MKLKKWIHQEKGKTQKKSNKKNKDQIRYKN